MKRTHILGFNRNELIIVTLILAVIFTFTGFNLRASFRLSRDNQRKSDIRAIAEALEKFQQDFSYFPASVEGKIAACEGTLDEAGLPKFKPCEWGWDSLRDTFDSEYPAYMERIPTDPHHNQGVRYLYISNGTRFQLFASLESELDDEYKTEVVARDLSCGTRQCNFGVGYSTTPIDKSIEEFESELLKKQEN